MFMRRLFKPIRQVFCKHTYCLKTLVATRYDASGVRYRVYKCTCSKCGKEKRIDKYIK